MATRNGGPACPKVERLEELLERVNEQLGQFDEQPKKVDML